MRLVQPVDGLFGRRLEPARRFGLDPLRELVAVQPCTLRLLGQLRKKGVNLLLDGVLDRLELRVYLSDQRARLLLGGAYPAESLLEIAPCCLTRAKSFSSEALTSTS